MKRRLAEHALFFREFLRTFHTTGAVAPSGRRLGAELARFVREPSTESRKILEVGPGTGAVTRHIVAGMGPNDRLDLVELNETFVRRLQDGFHNDPALRPAADRARVLHSKAEDLPAELRYDLIVSGLPLNNFAAAEVENILAGLIGRLMPDGVLSFFEYIGVRRIRSVISGPTERARLHGIGRAMHAALAGREIRRQAVLRNFPPAWVPHAQTPRS